MSRHFVAKWTKYKHAIISRTKCGWVDSLHGWFIVITYLFQNGGELPLSTNKDLILGTVRGNKSQSWCMDAQHDFCAYLLLPMKFNMAAEAILSFVKIPYCRNVLRYQVEFSLLMKMAVLNVPKIGIHYFKNPRRKSEQAYISGTVEIVKPDYASKCKIPFYVIPES